MDNVYQVLTIQVRPELHLRIKRRALYEQTNDSVLVREALVAYFGGDEDDVYLREHQKTRRKGERER